MNKILRILGILSVFALNFDISALFDIDWPDIKLAGIYKIIPPENPEKLAAPKTEELIDLSKYDAKELRERKFVYKDDKIKEEISLQVGPILINNDLKTVTFAISYENGAAFPVILHYGDKLLIPVYLPSKSDFFWERLTDWNMLKMQKRIY